MLGLSISSVFSSVVAIYIMVPLIIVPQILLSGVVVNYNKLNNLVASKEFVPFVGDIMASRWAYEALMVTQFDHNEYQKNYFEVEKQESNDKFKLLFVLPELKKTLYSLKSLKGSEIKNHQDDLKLLYHEIKLLKNSEYSDYFSGVKYSYPEILQTGKAISQINDILPDKLTYLSHKKDSITNNLVSKYGGVDNYLEFKNNYYNNSLADIVLKRKELESFEKAENKIIRLMEPVYQVPDSKYGRAQFLSSSKLLFGIKIDSMLFNMLAIWVMSFLVYVLLIFFPNFRSKPKKILQK